MEREFGTRQAIPRDELDELIARPRFGEMMNQIVLKRLANSINTRAIEADLMTSKTPSHS